jgi:hypothetical protein
VCPNVCSGMTTNRGWWCRVGSTTAYRVYDDHLLDRVRKIRGLIDVCIPMRIISSILPCLDQAQEIVVADPTRDFGSCCSMSGSACHRRLIASSRTAIRSRVTSKRLDDAATRLQKLRFGLGPADLRYGLDPRLR